MSSRGRGIVMVAIALLGVAAAGGLAIAMRRTRAAQQEVYERDRGRLRKDAGATRRPAREPDPSPRAARRHCVGGVDTFVVAVARSIVDVPRGDRVARLAAIKQASDWAVRAERAAELERPAPTLPQRMGSVADASAPGGRRALEPVRDACGGKGFAEFDDYRPRAKDAPATAPRKPTAPTATDSKAKTTKANPSKANPSKANPSKPKPKPKAKPKAPPRKIP
jgi:hypothetical protein